MSYKFPLEDDDQEPVHRLFCRSCGSNQLFTEQEYKTSLYPLDKLKCNCGQPLYHMTDYRQKKWVDSHLRNRNQENK